MTKIWLKLSSLFKPKGLKWVMERCPEGYIVHFEQYPNTYAQGKTQAEALANLLETIAAILIDDKQEESSNPNITTGELPFQLVP